MKTIKIDGREYQIDTGKALELGVLKEADPYHGWRVTSWDEYETEMKRLTDIEVVWDGMPTISESEAFVALGKLIHLRDAWWGKWKPNWNNIDTKHTLVNSNGTVIVNTASRNSRILSFPTVEMAESFYHCHTELINKAKMFL